MMLLCAFLVISFSQYKQYMNIRISFSNFSDVLPDFFCARAIVNVLSICLGDNIFTSSPYIDLYLLFDVVLE